MYSKPNSPNESENYGKPKNSGKSNNTGNLNKENKPKKPKNAKKAFALSKQYIDSTIPPIVKNELIEEDVMRYTQKGNLVPQKSIVIAEALITKTDFQYLRMYSEDKNLFQYYRQDIGDYETYSSTEMKIIMCRMLEQFPLPAVRADSLLTRILFDLRNSKLTAIGPYPDQDENPIDELDDNSSIDL